MRMWPLVPSLLFVALAVSGCAAHSALPPESGFGTNPVLPAPDPSLLPTVQIPDGRGWPQGAKPKAANGLQVQPFATQLDHPRWLYVLPNGDVLVAETNSPPRESPYNFVKSLLFKAGMKRAGAGGASANRLTLLRDANGDGVVETRSVFLQNLHSPFGMAVVGNTLFVANTDAIMRYQWQPGVLNITQSGEKLADLPALPFNHHWTKNILASPDGKFLYATVGSNSNIGENGMHNETLRAAILEVDIATGRTRLFASGLRNPNGLDWHPDTGMLWTVVNERDELGNDLVPDYLTSVKDGGFYGWPWSYFGQHVDPRVKPERPDSVAKAISPDYALGAHSAAMSLVFYRGTLLPASYRSGAFIGLHGSWNRQPPSGYKVIFVPFKNGRPAGMPQDVLTGFLSANAEAAYGRPVGVAVDKHGALLVSDDVGNTVWRVTPSD